MPSSTRETILDTATDLFFENGFHATGIERIIEEADIAKMTLYNHFGSKQELINEVIDRTSQDLLDWIDQQIDESGESPEEKLLGLFDAFQDWFNDDSFRGCPFLKASSEYSGQREFPHQRASRFKEELFERIQTQVSKLDLENTEDLAWKFFLLLEGAISMAHILGEDHGAIQGKQAAETLLEAEREETLTVEH